MEDDHCMRKTFQMGQARMGEGTMKKQVLITVKGSNHYEENQMDAVEFLTTGDFYEKQGKYYIKYEEADQSGMPDTTTTLKIEPSRVTITRFGKNNSQMVIEQGKKHIGHYETPYGGFTVGVISESADIRVNETSGRLDLKYDVELNDIVTSHNNICVTFKEVNGD